MPSPVRIEPIPGYSPAIGRLVGMLTYARSTTLNAVEGLTVAQLDHLHDPESNSIGALLAHIAAVEKSYQVLTFEDRLLSAEENQQLATALKLGEEGRRTLRGRPLQNYLDGLAQVRQDTLTALAARDDAWLDRSVTQAPRINAHWAWFHVAEDEINHRGQIRWLRARLPKVTAIVLAICVFGSVAFGQMAPADSGAVRAQRARFAGMMAADLPALDTLVDDDIVYTHTDGEVQSKAQFLETVRSGQIIYLGISPSEIHVQLVGDSVAVLTGRSHMTLGGATSRQFDIRFIDVEVRRNGRWKCLDWQSTRLP